MTAQELYEIVRKEIDVRAFYDPNYRAIQKKIDEQKADFNDTARLSRLLSQILGEKLAKHILELHPDEGRSELCQQLLKDFFDEINHKLAQVQTSLDKKNGISLNPVQPSFPAERVQNVAGSLNDSRASDETIQRRCRNAVANVANTMHDSFIQVNAKFRNNVGLFVQVTRTGGAECCDWCAQVSGTFWGYNRDLREVFRRHDKCTCIITYTSSKTRSRLVGESDGAGGTTHKWVESQKSWQEKPILPDVRPTRFTPEQAKRFETGQLRKMGLVRVGDGVKWVGNNLTNSGDSGRIEVKYFGDFINAVESVESSGHIPTTKKKNQIQYPDEISGTRRGKAMSFDEANHMSVNPNFHKDKHYKNNCQTCVVAFEARLRGYDVEANPNTRHSMSWRVSAQTNLPWIDPETGEHPEYIFDETANTPETFMEFMERTVHQGERYTIGFSRKLGEPHIIFLDRTDSGKLRLYDPQNGKTYTGIKLSLYLKTIKYVHRDGNEFNQRYDSPRLLRVDNALFDMSIVEKLLKGKE